ncbi:hypothetical protein [Pseudomonas aeruginosa]
MRRSKLTKENRILKPAKLAHRNNKLTEASGFENLCKNGFSNAASNANAA